MDEQKEAVTKEGKEKKTKTPEQKAQVLELFIAIMLGITALLTAWASWIGSLHGGNQATNYATSNNLSAEGNSTWNEASQYLQQDLEIWNKINDLSVDISFAEENGDQDEVDRLNYKLQQIYDDNVTDEFYEAIMWALDQEEYATPFMMDGYIDSYFVDAQALLQESADVLAQGQEDNSNGDRLGLVTVIYSVVLFLLGITNTFKNMKNRYIVTGISVVGFLLATIFMFTIPLPTGFNIITYFFH